MIIRVLDAENKLLGEADLSGSPWVLTPYGFTNAAPFRMELSVKGKPARLEIVDLAKTLLSRGEISIEGEVQVAEFMDIYACQLLLRLAGEPSNATRH